jgi:hypothetical protein
MDCYTGTGMLLLVIIAALFFLLKREKENGSALLKWIAWLCITIAFACILCMGYKCLHNGCCTNDGKGGSNCGSKTECRMEKNCGMKEQMRCNHEEGMEEGMMHGSCCEDDSTGTEKVFVNENGDTVKVEKNIKIIRKEKHEH